VSDVLTRLGEALSGRYRLAREIGVGGMATVYLAHDVRHDRDVAIKVLHPELAAALGAERFLLEIKTTAKLQHPHILPLLDSGEADGLLYYVMPYVAGESLRVRLDRETQLSVDDAVRIGREVASALESAHKQGVVHRDIKPENILIHEDQALVADFGIALAVRAAGGARLTETGLSLGTPQYMAPEQAVGERAIDGRADIYALGAVLYEMLVGEAPFTGPTVQAVVARVMTEQPRPITGQRRSVPPHVNAAVLKALEKLPADRFHSAGEFSKALVTPGFETTRIPASAAQSPLLAVHGALRRPSVAWTVAGLLALAALALLARGGGRQDRPVVHLAVDLAPEMSLDPLQTPVAQLSPDGSTLAIGILARNVAHLVVRRLGIDSLRYVEGSAGLRGGPAFSPDGRWIAFNAEDKILKVPINGGPPTVLGHAYGASITWSPSDILVYNYNYDTGLRRVSAEGRDDSVLTKPDRKRGELGHWWPQVLPDGDHVLFTNYTTPADKSRLEVLSLKTGERTVVLEGAYFGRYAAGWLLFVRGELVHRVAFDVSRLKLNGSPVPTGLDIAINSTNGSAALSLAANGTLAYLRGGSSLIEVVRIDRRGNEEPALDSAGHFTEVADSPDGRRIGVIRDGDVWVFERQRKLFTRLTRSEQRERSLVWTPDSRELFYVRDVPQFDVFKRAADAGRAEELVLTSEVDKQPHTVSPDGTVLLYSAQSKPGDEEDIWEVSINSRERKSPQLVLGGAGRQVGAAFSPDGKRIAYISNESGRDEVYVVPYPSGGRASRQQVSLAGGGFPKWAKDEKSIYYSWAGRIFRVSVDPATEVVGTPELLPRIERMRGWSLGADDRLLVSRTPEGVTSQSVKVVLNWASSLVQTRD
jgi:eukaryotic-like serine/threonine-protein kinase